MFYTFRYNSELKNGCRHLETNCVYRQQFYEVFPSPCRISFIQSSVSQSVEPPSILARERMSLLRMPISYPLTIPSPVMNEQKAFHSFPRRCCPVQIKMCYMHQIQNKHIFAKINCLDEVKHEVFSPYCFQMIICQIGYSNCHSVLCMIYTASLLLWNIPNHIPLHGGGGGLSFSSNSFMIDF